MNGVRLRQVEPPRPPWKTTADSNSRMEIGILHIHIILKGESVQLRRETWQRGDQLSSRRMTRGVGGLLVFSVCERFEPSCCRCCFQIVVKTWHDGFTKGMVQFKLQKKVNVPFPPYVASYYFHSIHNGLWPRQHHMRWLQTCLEGCVSEYDCKPRESYLIQITDLPHNTADKRG